MAPSSSDTTDSSPDSLQSTRRANPHITVNSGSGGDILQGFDATNPDSVELTRTSTAPGVTSRNMALPRANRMASSQSLRQNDGDLTHNSSSNPRHVYATRPFESSDMLLPPSKSRTGPIRNYSDVPSALSSRVTSAMSSRRGSSESKLPLRDDIAEVTLEDIADVPSALSSRVTSAMSSRRGSFDSELGHARNPFISHFDDSRAPSVTGSEDDNVNTQTVSEKYNITPSAGLLLYPEDIEKDDWLHNPSPDDKDDRCDIWNKRAMVNLGGLGLITFGVLFLFVGYPVLTFVRQQLGLTGASCATDPNCISATVPLLKNQRKGLIDPDTPASAMTKTSHDGTKLNLVFSDEFNKDGRTFYGGDDPYFEAVDIWYGVTQDLEWYDPDAVSTANGTLNIKFDAFQSHNLNYRSGMLQSWNKLCFKGGRMEASIQLPGRGDIEGFWPGFWAMGNLGRPGYPATTDGLWPYSYWDKCDYGITANQSAPDGLSLLPGMRLPACTCANQDHPSAGISRSAPEIDALEASVGFMGPGQYDAATGTASQSLQVAPFDIWYQPDYNYLEIYDQAQTGMNAYRGGVYQEALSGVTWLNNEWYEAKGKFQVYGFEYTPGAEGDVAWFVGNQYTWAMDHRALRPNGNIGQRVIPQEPMSIIANFGMSNSFAQVFLANLAQLMPATMRLDYIRIYQAEGAESVTCDPPGYPTTAYIKNHPEPYANPNLTLWSATPYKWPTNTFVNNCKA